MSESELVNEVIRALYPFGYPVRCNAGQIKLSTGRWIKLLPKGFADILFIRPDGQACFVETKVGRNTTTAEQDAFLERMRELGCRAGVARSVADAMAICGVCDVGAA